MRIVDSLILLVLSFVLLQGLTSQAEVISPDLEFILDSLDPGDDISVIVTFYEKANLKNLMGLEKTLSKSGIVTKEQRHFMRSQIVQALKSKAESIQDPIRTFLTKKGVNRITSLWIINAIAITASTEIVRGLAGEPGIESIRLNSTIPALKTAYGMSSEVEWNLDMVRVQELWDLGFTGEGIVIGSMSTGVDINHPDLAGNWRGGSNSWFDPNNEHETPYDIDGHGTQTMGIMVGGDIGGTAIGMAPGAKWIAVKIFNDAGLASHSSIHQGFQWLLDPDGDPATDDAPDIVNNSWGLRENIGECVMEFKEDVEILKAMDIAVVFSAGTGGGPSYSTSISPANYPETLSVSAIDDRFTILFSSNRGFSACDGGIYPDFVAPGLNIKTTDLTFGGLFPNAYTYVTGSSFAAPHVAGAIALLRNAFPNILITDIESALRESAMDLGKLGPDNDYGYGLVDIVKTYNSLLSISSNTNVKDWVLHSGK